jgi:hypothetical protein
MEFSLVYSLEVYATGQNLSPPHPPHCVTTKVRTSYCALFVPLKSLVSILLTDISVEVKGT